MEGFRLFIYTHTHTLTTTSGEIYPNIILKELVALHLCRSLPYTVVTLPHNAHSLANES